MEEGQQPTLCCAGRKYEEGACRLCMRISVRERETKHFIVKFNVFCVS